MLKTSIAERVLEKSKTVQLALMNAVTKTSKEQEELLMGEDVTLEENVLDLNDAKNAVHLDKGQVKGTSEADSSIVELIYCYLCDFSCTDEKELDIHNNENHKCIKCDECDYTAIDLEILRNHKFIHTRVSAFQCKVCEFEASSKVLLDGHTDSKHRKSDVRPNICVYCDQVFVQRFLLEQHECYLCQRCHHVEQTKEKLAIHTQTMHLVPRVKLEKVFYRKCEICDYTCKLNIQLKRHMRETHVEKGHSQCDDVFIDKSANIICQFCGLILTSYESLNEHIKVHHTPPDLVDCQYCDKKVSEADQKDHMYDYHEDLVILHTMARQVNDMNDEFEAFKAFKNEMKQMMKVVLENQTALKQELSLLRNQKSEDATKFKKDEINGRKIEKTYENERKGRNKKPDIVFVGESVTEVLDKQTFENDCSANVTFVETSQITDNSEASPVSEALKKDADVLVLQGGMTEISNIEVNEALMDTKRSIDDYKREWFEKVEADSCKIFNVAQAAIKKNEALKVVVVKRLPRYDKRSSDLLGIKAELSHFANTTYDQLWLKSGKPQNIKIINVELQTGKYSHLKDLIFGPINSSSYDGIHFRGKGAARHISYRLKQALRPAMLEFGLGLGKPVAAGKTPKINGRSVNTKSYVDAVSKTTSYSVPTSNRFSPLN